MRRRVHFVSAILFVAAGAITTPAYAQLRPHEITGMPTSAIHCLSGDAANIHSLGWIETGGRYVINFDSDFDPATAFVRFDLSTPGASLVDGRPGFNGTAASSGMMVLHVASKTGEAGCYRYSVAIDPPSARAADAPPDIDPAALAAAVVERRDVNAFAPLAVSGAPSSAQHCVSGSYVPNVHNIGHIDRTSQVTIAFDADFDAFAGVTRTMLGATGSSGRYLTDDNSGGGRNPAISFTAAAGDNIVLYVTGVNGAAGCYRYKVEIR